MSVRIRLATPSDGESLARIYAPAVTDKPTSFELQPPTAGQMSERVAKTLPRYPWLVADDGALGVIGYAYGSTHRERAAYQWTVEVSAYVDDRAQRRGVGRGLYIALLEVLRLQNYRTAVAGITLPNEASVAFHRSMGFEPIGVFRRVGYKFGRWWDTDWSWRALGPSDDPAPPIALAEVIDRPEFEAALRRGEDVIANR